MNYLWIFAIGILVGFILGIVCISCFVIRDIKRKSELAYKQSSVVQMLNKWLLHKQKGNSIADYLYDKGYHEIAVYGMNYLGERLIDDLLESKIKVSYVIDKNAKCPYPNISTCTPNDSLKKVDAIIVSINYLFDEINMELSERVDYPIINLEELLFDM
ncbi:MAG: hypothetical protein KHZ83_04490 [Roseburia sp.]|nr:hypothetical protein [Roseburia sp.]